MSDAVPLLGTFASFNFDDYPESPSKKKEGDYFCSPRKTKEELLHRGRSSSISATLETQISKDDLAISWMPTSIEEETGGAKKTSSLLFLGFDLTGLSESVQFGIIFVSLLFFMCLYGLFQEIVIYDWFQRKLSVFTAALHFLGCIFCAFVLQMFTSESRNTGFISMVLSRRAPLHSYAGLCALKAATQLFTNISMQHINFPTKILLKASLPVLTMLLGFLLQKKFYSLFEVFSVVILTVGLTIFLLGDNFALPEGTSVGFMCVFLSLLTSALTPMVQEDLSIKYSASSAEILLNTYIGSFLISLLLCIVFGELHDGLEMLLSSGSFFYWISLFCFCTFGFLGANCSIGITIRYGPLTNGICNSCRKVISILISIFSFPDRNSICATQFFGILMFIFGLFLRTQAKYKNKSIDAFIPDSDHKTLAVDI